MKQNLQIVWVVFLLLNANTARAQDYIQTQAAIEERYNISIIYDEYREDIWGLVTYDNISDEKQLSRYMELLEYETAKYPAHYFNAVGIRAFVLGENMAFNSQYRAAVPDPYTGSLYLSTNGAYDTSTDSYLIHTFHHELHHCSEYTIWGDMRYKWDEWEALNTEDFRYGTGGESAYTNLNFDYYSPVHPQAGFLNHYSITGQEEDRCEIIAFWLTDSERELVEPIIEQDIILQKKLELLRILLIEQFEADIL